jgi:hypothetical protein
MTWIPCSWCHNAPCTCQATTTIAPWQTPTGTLAWPALARLSDEDVERIARRVFSLMREEK